MFTDFSIHAYYTMHHQSIIIVGFDRVFPMKRLRVFSPYELRLLLCGEQSPSWTKDDVLKYTEPKYGYNQERSVDIEDVIIA